MMRITIQTSKSTRITFFSFCNGEMNIERILTVDIQYSPFVVERIGLSKEQNEQLDNLMYRLKQEYQSKQPQQQPKQLSLSFGE